MFKLFTSALLPRFLRFRKEVVILWHAFRAPETPLYLKIATALVAFYLINPFDLIPEVLPFFGFIDDMFVVPMMVSWIVSRLPIRAEARARRPDAGPTIDGSSRRL